MIGYAHNTIISGVSRKWLLSAVVACSICTRKRCVASVCRWCGYCVLRQGVFSLRKRDVETKISASYSVALDFNSHVEVVPLPNFKLDNCSFLISLWNSQTTMRTVQVPLFPSQLRFHPPSLTSSHICKNTAELASPSLQSTSF